MNHDDAIDTPGARDAGLTVSRRHFLATTAGGLAACTAAPRMPPGMLDGNPIGLRHRLENAAQVAGQLRTFRDHALPWLLRRPRVDESFIYVGFVEPDPEDVAAYRATTDGLLALLEGRGTRRPEQGFAAVLRPARSRMCESARQHLLNRHEVDASFVASRSRAASDGSPIWSWRCSALGVFLPDALLASYWEEIRTALGLPVSAQPSSVRHIRPRHLIRCFRRLQPDDYFRLAYGLVQLFPDVPPRLVAIPDDRRRRSRSLSTFTVFDGGPYTRGRVSHLYGGTLEFLANNHFHLLPPLAQRVEMCGSWLPFIAGQVLDVLYQKTLVLTWLRAASGSAAGWKSPRPW